MVAADACAVLGFGAFVSGVWWNWGTGWSLIAAGALLIWVAWRAYRAPRRRHETA